ncbi:MAG: hypothetical protein AAB869_01705 [Patescibacteria group bacterium]
MKVAYSASLLTVLIGSVVLPVNAGGKEPGVAVYALERTVDTKAVNVLDVSFVSPKKGTALTRVQVIKKGDPLQQTQYDFGGYHPEITPGLNGEVIRTYSWLSPYPDEGKYRSHFCIDRGQTCWTVHGE